MAAGEGSDEEDSSLVEPPPDLVDPDGEGSDSEVEVEPEPSQ